MRKISSVAAPITFAIGISIYATLLKIKNGFYWITINLIRFFRSLSLDCIVAKTVRKRIGRKKWRFIIFIKKITATAEP
jgi:hypothetical protein